MAGQGDQNRLGIEIPNYNSANMDIELSKNEEEKLTSIYSAGIGYEASEKFFISVEIEKEEDRPVNVDAGLQYKFLPQLMTRAGLSSATSTAWMGVGISIRSFRIDAAASYHPHLGITPGLMFLFNFRSPETIEKKID